MNIWYPVNCLGLIQPSRSSSPRNMKVANVFARNIFKYWGDNKKYFVCLACGVWFADQSPSLIEINFKEFARWREKDPQTNANGLRESNANHELFKHQQLQTESFYRYWEAVMQFCSLIAAASRWHKSIKIFINSSSNYGFTTKNTADVIKFNDISVNECLTLQVIIAWINLRKRQFIDHPSQLVNHKKIEFEFWRS